MALSKLALRFIAERRRRGEIGEETARNTRYRLMDFAAHAPDDPRRLRRRHIEKWALEQPELAAASRRIRLSNVHRFCEWLILNRHIDRDPSIGIKGPPMPQRQPRNLHADESPRLLVAAPDARARLIVLLMLQEGLRCCEVTRSQVGDIDRVRGVIDVRGKAGGGHATRSLPVSRETLVALDAYLFAYPAPDGPLIRSYTRPWLGLTSAHLGCLVRDWMRDAGIKRVGGDGKSAHSCRHTAASDMVESGADVLQVQRALGHRSIQSTMVYLRGVTPDLRDAMGGRTYTEPPDGQEDGAAA